MARYTDPENRPRVQAPLLDNIPDELKQVPQWVLWRFEWRDDRDGRGEWSKVPHSACQPGAKASSTDARTWSPFDEAAELYATHDDFYDGIGFVFSETDEYAGIDFDNCVNEHGQIPTDVAQLLVDFGTYTEISPSGTGLHCIVRARISGGRKDTSRGIEVYDRGRYFTFTGRFWQDFLAIGSRQAQVDALISSIEQRRQERRPQPVAAEAGRRRGAPPKQLQDLLELAFAAANGAEIRALYNGDTSAYAGDDSSADMALCCYLAFYTGPDADLLDKLFRTSKLYRRKWDRRATSDGRTYGQLTIENALSSCKRFYTPGYTRLKIGSNGHGEQPPEDRPRVHVLSAEQLLKKQFGEPRYAVPGLIAEGLQFLAGKPKIGKSWLALSLAIGVASGTTVLGNRETEQGEVLYLALEDGPRRLQRRLRKLLIGRKTPALLSLATEWPGYEQGAYEAVSDWLGDHPNARLVIIDTFKRIRPHEDVRRSVYAGDYEAVAPLSTMAQSFGVAILLVHHVRKAESLDDPFDLISGSTGLTGAADGMLVLQKKRGTNEGTLHVTGRDVDEQELTLSWDQDRAEWSVLGDAATVQMSRERQEIVDLLVKVGGPASPRVVADLLGKPYGTVKKLLWQMAQDGQLSHVRGFYEVVMQ